MSDESEARVHSELKQEEGANADLPECKRVKTEKAKRNGLATFLKVMYHEL
jgi:hypothetical protein